MKRSASEVRRLGRVALADSLMNRALRCDVAGRQDLATAHLEVAEQVMLAMAADGSLVMETEGDE